MFLSRSSSRNEITMKLYILGGSLQVASPQGKIIMRYTVNGLASGQTAVKEQASLKLGFSILQSSSSSWSFDVVFHVMFSYFSYLTMLPHCSRLIRASPAKLLGVQDVHIIDKEGSRCLEIWLLWVGVLLISPFHFKLQLGVMRVPINLRRDPLSCILKTYSVQHARIICLILQARLLGQVRVGGSFLFWQARGSYGIEHVNTVSESLMPS